MSVKFGLWTFHEVSKRQKILTLLTCGCPADDSSHVGEGLKSEKFTFFKILTKNT